MRFVVVWDYCILSKWELENSSDELNASDEMQIEMFNQLANFYQRFKTFSGTHGQ